MPEAEMYFHLKEESSQDKDLRKHISRTVESTSFNVLSTLCLLIALFGSGTCVLMDLPDWPTNAIMDVVMTIVMMLFIVECVLRSYGQYHVYFLSFFFWMDVLGSASMVFDISFILGDAGKISTSGENGMNTVMMRAARAARVGARAGRLLKPLKWLQEAVLGEGEHGHEEEKRQGRDAKLLGARLTRVLSTKVALLTVVLVLGVPFFDVGCYPVDDFSKSSWTFKLETDYGRAYRALQKGNAESSSLFQGTVADMVTFYGDFQYFPYQIVGFPDRVVAGGDKRLKSIPGEGLVTGDAPVRKQNIVKHQVKHCQFNRENCQGEDKAFVYFDFTDANQHSTAMHFLVTLFIVTCMATASFDLSRAVDAMVVQPMESMLGTARSLSKLFMQSAEDAGIAAENEDFDENDLGGDDETLRLQNMFAKTARLAKVLMRKKTINEAEIQDLSDESKGILFDVLSVSGGRTVRLSSQFTVRDTNTPLITDLAIEPSEIASWGFNSPSLETPELQKVALHLMFDSEVGMKTGRLWCNPEKFQPFLDKVKLGYFDNPYHNFIHAVDVMSSCTRILKKVQWEYWLGDIDVYALLVASLCHDIGHAGYTNPFLVETSDVIALRYNDKSPLENMHAATLFEIVNSDPRVNVFQMFNKASMKQVRSVCISAILHTDNATHFEMVKDVQTAYEVASDICHNQARSLRPQELDSDYCNEVLNKHLPLWIKLFLHLADVSNPLKTFEMNQVWAGFVVDEFFNQGDKEKELGIPVGFLNDRDKVVRAGAEHGFIVFLVSPLVLSAANVFPMLVPFAAQMAMNLESWRDVWVEKAKPPEEDIKKRDVDVKKVQDQVQHLEDVASNPELIRGQTNPNLDR